MGCPRKTKGAADDRYHLCAEQHGGRKAERRAFVVRVRREPSLTGTAPRTASLHLAIYASGYSIHTRPHRTLASRDRPPTLHNWTLGIASGLWAAEPKNKDAVVAIIRVQKLIPSGKRGDDDISDIHVRQRAVANVMNCQPWEYRIQIRIAARNALNSAPRCDASNSGEAQTNCQLGSV